MVESETTRLREEHTESPATPGQPLHKKKKGLLLRALREQNDLLRAQLEGQNQNLQRQAQSIDQLQSTVAALAAREPAAAPTKAEEDAETMALLRDAKREINTRVLAALRGEDPVAAKAVDNALAQVRKLLKDVAEVKDLANEAAATLGTQAAAPEESFAKQLEDGIAAAERVSQTRVGQKLLAKVGLAGDAAETPAIENKTEADVSATYG